jgi:hypothetical protein
MIDYTRKRKGPAAGGQLVRHRARDRSSGGAGGARVRLPLRIPWSLTTASPNLKYIQYNVELAFYTATI